MLRTAAATLTIAILFLAITASLAFAATGAIVSPDQYAWSDNGGYVNWNASGGNVAVTDTALTGYIWSAGFGWINLSPTNGGVTNNGGMLGGDAWGANTGWIDFTGVTIDGNGNFRGHTVAQSIFGTMTFDCTYCDVATTWRSSSGTNPAPQTPTSGGNGPPPSGPLSFGYQTASTPTSSQSMAVHAAAANVPASLIPTSPPPVSEPTTKPSKSRTPLSQGQPALPPTSQPAPTASTTEVVPSPIPAAERPPSSQSSAPSVSTPPSTCSWLTCWAYDLWQFLISHL